MEKKIFLCYTDSARLLIGKSPRKSIAGQEIIDQQIHMNAAYAAEGDFIHNVWPFWWK